VVVWVEEDMLSGLSSDVRFQTSSREHVKGKVEHVACLTPKK
jgi:hypothetical protein